MFGRKKPETVSQQSSHEEVVEDKQSADERIDDAPRAVLGLGAAAIGEQRGFKVHESGLLVPDGSAKVTVNGEHMVTDSRKITLEQVEETFNAEQERLDSPLDMSEYLDAIQKIEEQVRRRNDEYDGDDATCRADISRDVAAVYKIKKALVGTYDSYTSNVVEPNEDIPLSERFSRVVGQYVQLVPENFGPDSHIGSMGGTVRIADNGEVHSEGYNGSILYEFGRAQQICQKLETMPREVRETITESPDVDATWLYDEPVIVNQPDRDLEPTA